ncbi:alginate O-acetyltransferase AlgX-related protein [Oribacterium sp. WCC10]|uniref:alginate O-acetyltransferase AlgX-related protein n=1 Tax=Oribacterium sp. WCC10 TaxID=1855343 RepID=UPI0008EF02FC|nr:hypothetical protein [Oribacterium sp. WCC10]SFG75199.1 SGNH hydrolase-like domain-containing protein, acetyltransferase AlgX [Oribacterium sp. WCC10]
MNYFFRKRAFALIFTLLIMIFSGYNLYINGENVFSVVKNQYENQSVSTSEIEDSMLENIIYKRGLVEVYGLTQKMLLKNEYNDFDYIKDEKGFLNYARFYSEDTKDIFDYALRVKRLQDYVSEYGTRVLFVITPSKYIRGTSRFEIGMPISDPDHEINELMVYLNRLGVKTLNMGEYFPLEDLSYEETFFKTDHHWTVPAAFRATGILVEEIKKKFGDDLDPTGYYTSTDAYREETYYGHMFGALGRDTGIIYAGLDDFTALYPKYAGNYIREYTYGSGNIFRKEGSFEETFLDKSVLADDIDLYEESQYSLYINQVREIENIENLDNVDGKNIFMIRDSYFGPVITFMAPMCKRIDAVYALMHDNDPNLSVSDYLKDRYDEGYRYDYVIIEIYPYNIEDNAFRYFRVD